MEKNELPKDVAQLIDSGELEKVAGGYIYYAGRTAAVPSKPWEVIDDGDGKVIGRYATRDEALAMTKPAHPGQTFTIPAEIILGMKY